MPNSKKLRVSGPARNDLGRIGAFTQREWGIRQKRKYLGQIRDGFKAIRNTPGLGAPQDEIAKGLRAYLVDKHVICYRESKTKFSMKAWILNIILGQRETVPGSGIVAFYPRRVKFG